jgi:hypothetical protein
MKGLEGNYDVERILVRDALLALAEPLLYDAVTKSTKHLPREELAAFVEGDADRVSRVEAGSRDRIAALVRKRFPGGAADPVTEWLKVREPGLLPCVFVVRLGGGTIDVSVVALHTEPEDDTRP